MDGAAGKKAAGGQGIQGGQARGKAVARGKGADAVGERLELSMMTGNKLHGLLVRTMLGISVVEGWRQRQSSKIDLMDVKPPKSAPAQGSRERNTPYAPFKPRMGCAADIRNRRYAQKIEGQKAII